MPRVERFFTGTNVEDWMSGALGGGAAGADYSTTGYTTERTYTGYQSISWGTTGTLVLTAAKTVDIWVVAGGGGGGSIGYQSINAGASGGGGGGAFGDPRKGNPVEQIANFYTPQANLQQAMVNVHGTPTVFRKRGGIVSLLRLN